MVTSYLAVTGAGHLRALGSLLYRPENRSAQARRCVIVTFYADSFGLLAPPSPAIPKAVWKVGRQMAMRYGRLVKRAPLIIPIRISSLLNPYAAERTTTENICSLGLRAMVRQARKPNELMLINSADGELKTAARVVYCERMGDGRFALGLEFNEEITNWPQSSVGPRD